MRDLRTYFPIRRGVFQRAAGFVKAVDGVSFDVHAGKTLGLVGESGCGKTTVGRTLLRLIPATGGSVLYNGRDFFAYHGEELRKLRRHMQIIFQDPVSSLNPRMTIGNIIGEPIQVHGIARGKDRTDMVASLLARVGLDPTFASRYPHEFSGGQRQRIGIARALALQPDFIVCDEPVSALDVSIQSQILNLLQDLQAERKIAFLFIDHNLAVVEHFSNEVAVMYLGRIVEKAGNREAVHRNPKHLLTRSCVAHPPSRSPIRVPSGTASVLSGEVAIPQQSADGLPVPSALPPGPPGRRGRRRRRHGANHLRQRPVRCRMLRKCVEQMPPLEQKQGWTPATLPRAGSRK